LLLTVVVPHVLTRAAASVKVAVHVNQTSCAMPCPVPKLQIEFVWPCVPVEARPTSKRKGPCPVIGVLMVQSSFVGGPGYDMLNVPVNPAVVENEPICSK